jgi:hypothetical protein
MNHIFPFGSPLKKVEQQDRTHKKVFDNSILLTYVDKSNFLGENDKKDTLRFTTFPTIRIELSDNNLRCFQLSTDYIKLADEFLEAVNFTLPANTLPQDITELYMREIATRLVNAKFKISFKTNEIIDILN